jgi:signal transduction histidine kinase
MSEGMIITDQRGAVVRFNAVARSLLTGTDGWIVVGAPLDQLDGVADESVADALASLVDGLRQRQSSDVIEIDTTHEHQRRTLHFSASHLRDGGGIIIIRDVTELRALDRLRAQVLRVASHDLQNPLTALKGRAQLLLRALGDDRNALAKTELFKQGLATMVQQTSRVSEMLRLLLDLSRMAGDGRLDLQRQETDLMSLIAEVVETLQPVSPDHSFVTRGPASLSGNWDAHRLLQVLQNLIGNAIKYSPRGGPIEISAEIGSDRQVRVDVTDQGLGLTPDQITHVFDEFYRASHATSLEGSGLGLYICQAIVSAHGGRIWATSPGSEQGSTFSFVIPA